MIAIACVAMLILGFSMVSYLRRAKSNSGGDLAYVSVDD